MRTLTAEDIVRVPRPIELVELLEVGNFRLRALSGDGATFYMCLCKSRSESDEFDFRGVKETLVALAVVGDDDLPLFPFDLDDPDSLKPAIKAFGSLPAAVLDTLFERVQGMNPLGDDDDDDVDTIAGN